MNPFEMRPSVFFDRRSSSVSSREPNRRPSQVSHAFQAKLEQHTKMYASMCPDEILDYCDDYSTRVYHTTLMLGDVSGFTELAEKYTKSGKGGPSKLTETLNSYIGAMVQEILSHNGDVLKFSGDAFIVMWKLEEGMTMRDLAVEAIQTACIIQKHFGIYETEVDVTLRVKLAIASGKTYFTSIGDPLAMSYYIITGNPVWDVKNAEGLCRGGDILVAPSSWQWANPNEYVFETLPDGIHTLILASSTAWYHSRESELGSIHSLNVYEDGDYEGPRSDGSVFSKMYPDDGAVKDGGGQDFEEDQFSQVDYSLRPKVIKVAKEQFNDALRSYMLRPVVRSVEMDEPLEYLTEMRQVVILFINVITMSVGKKSLISLVNAAYKEVCKLIAAVQGCVNKTSLFDKDLMFLCIFGLRGDKHELESQIGLRCAYRIRQVLVEMKNVKSVTIGVTTGITYCGVVGHILRREYTVIGMSVNKAARLMCAYRDKVVCDRESFLHSHLEARHFILQEPKPLKGITNVGPVYEFQDDPEIKESDLIVSKYPLLGREFEIRVFRKMLMSLIEYNNSGRTAEKVPKHNTLILKGESRIGKTRLLDEMTQNIPAGVATHYLSLSPSDAKVPYGLLHLLFAIPMGFTLTTTRKEREEKVLQYLGPFRDPHYLAVLNEIFRVRFTRTSSLQIVSEADRDDILRKFLQIIVYTLFASVHVIIIDDAEYTDAESMGLLDSVTKSDTVLFVLSFGRKIVESNQYPSFRGKAKVLEVQGIDKLYHAGLACQILKVGGIPAELEKAIQEKSLGNPGWIESYLVSLVQGGGLTVLNINKKEAEVKGYVLPPAPMLTRLVSTKAKAIGRLEERTDKWQMYKTSIKDSIVSLLDGISDADLPTTGLESGDTAISVCKITENYCLEDIGGEITMDVMILKLFDSLTPLDQLLLKCASVLGESLNRKLLESLMEDTPCSDIAVCVAKLFRIGVFFCGAGDFSKSQNRMVCFRNLRPDRHLEVQIRCDCIGIEIPVDMPKLPKYAFCGLMRFKMTTFRDTTYRLLTENQKMELHSKALKYIEKNARRCSACGEGQFTRLLGKTTTRQSYRGDDIDQILENLGEDVPEGDNNQKKDFHGAVACCMSFCRRVERKATNTFSNFDFANCQCHLILMSLYTQILDHCHGIGKNNLTLIALMESIEICLICHNVPQARKLVDDAENLLRQMSEYYEDEPITRSYLTGRIQILRGRCYIDSGLLPEAEKSLVSAMTNLSFKFPKTELAIETKALFELEELRFRLAFYNPGEVGNSTDDVVDYAEQLANCLTQMFDVFRVRGSKKHARLAALWALNAALSSTKDFALLCACLTNMLITAHIYRNRSIIPQLENLGIELCDKKKSNLELTELKVIAELYTATFFSRWVRGLIPKAIRIGFICMRMTQTMNWSAMRMIILPRLVHLLMLSCQHSQVVSQLRELEFLSNNVVDKSTRNWYFALCADIQLDTGLTVVPFNQCEQYYFRGGEATYSARDPEAQKRYFVSMWLWCLRTEQWEAAELWYQTPAILEDFMMDEHIVAATITSLKYLEGLLLLYVHKVNTKNVTANATMATIKLLFKKTSSTIKIVKICIPRYWVLKAYYNMIKSRRRTALKILSRARKIARDAGNVLMYTLIGHCEKSWTGSISSVQRDLWREAHNASLLASWTEINANDARMLPYTFPLPQYTF